MGHLMKSLQAEMKSIIAFCLILIATVSAQEDVCEMCKLGVGIFWGHLRTEQAMRHQRQHLIQDVCPHHGPQQHVCEDVINVHWKEINHVIYNDNTIPKVCSGITGQECMKMNERQPRVTCNCGECTCDEPFDDVCDFCAVCSICESTWDDICDCNHNDNSTTTSAPTTTPAPEPTTTPAPEPTTTPSPTEWDCDTCMGAVARLAMAYSTPEAIATWIDALSGKLYCQNPILALSEEDQAHCADMVSMFTGPAMRSLDAEYSGHAQLYCHFWYDGVCPQPSNSWLF